MFEPAAFYFIVNTMHWAYLPVLFVRFLTDVFGKRSPCCSKSSTRYKIEYMEDYDEEYVNSDRVGNYVWKELLKESPPLIKKVEEGIFYPQLWRGHLKKHHACFSCGESLGPPDGFLTRMYCRYDYIILEEAIHKEDRWVCFAQNVYVSELLPTIAHRDVRLGRTGDAMDFNRCTLIAIGPTRVPHCCPFSMEVTVRHNGTRVRKCYSLDYSPRCIFHPEIRLVCQQSIMQATTQSVLVHTQKNCYMRRVHKSSVHPSTRNY